MGVRIAVDGRRVEASSYTISESSTPIAGGDSSGAVGTIDLQLPETMASISDLGVQVDFLDAARGTTSGTIATVSHSRDSKSVSLGISDRLGRFVIETQAQPFVGTLEAAFTYYCSLAGITSDFIVDDAIKFTQVTFPGFSGNLWTYIKQMATAVGADLNVISNVITLRPIRKFEAVRDRETSSSVTADATQLALKQEVTYYDAQWIESGLIWPPGGWKTGTQVLSVNAGETTEYQLDTDSSIVSIDQPTCLASVGPNDSSASVYTVVGDDNVVIQPSQWADCGGSVSVSIDEDTRGITVTLRGATGIYGIDGAEMQSFRLAMSAGDSDSTYSTLRIVGDHVYMPSKTITIPTGVDESLTSQEFAPTIDNIFLNTLDAAYSAGVRGASNYSGKNLSYSSSVTAVNKRGEDGSGTYPTYADAVATLTSGGSSYGNVKSELAGLGVLNYGAARAYLYESVADDFDNQLFGNAPGARIFDRQSGHWFRVRTASTTWGATAIQADDDLLLGDIQDAWGGDTYGGVIARMGGKSYMRANLEGVNA